MGLGLGGENFPEKVSPDRVIDAVCERTKVKREDVFSLSKDRRISYSRHLAMYLLVLLSYETYADLSRLFRRDPSTVLEGVRRIDLETLTNKETSQDIVFISRRLVSVKNFEIVMRWYRSHH